MENSLPRQPTHPGPGPDMPTAQVSQHTPTLPDEQAKTQRLLYLFRRTSQQSHVLQKALFTYRGVLLP